MPTSLTAADVTVLGGGPAGATASLLLASWGHSVQLVTKSGAGRRLAVSLPPSCDKLFAAIGVTDAIEAAGFIRSTGNTVWWGGAAARVEPFADQARGWQVDVSRLADIILQRATGAGVMVERRMVVDPPRAEMFLDCTGRASVIARGGNLRRPQQDLHTVALIGEWRHSGWDVPDDSHTLIESYEDGWMWSVPIEPGVRHIAAMIDPQRSGLARGVSAKQIYLAEIGKTREFRRLTSRATLVDGPLGWDATQYDSIAYAGGNWMLVGDAGSFIDPLSSAGVKKALASGWLAAVVANTCIKSPSMKANALSFFSERESEIAAHLFRESRRFLSDAASGHAHSFWDERGGAVEDTSDRDAVRAALKRIKDQPAFKARLGPGISIEPRPIIRGNELVLEPHLVSGNDSRGIRYVAGIDMVALSGLAPGSRQVPDLYESYQNQLGPAALHDFLQALATAVARRWLVSE